MLLGYLLQGLPSFLEHKLLQEILLQECLDKVYLIEENKKPAESWRGRDWYSSNYLKFCRSALRQNILMFYNLNELLLFLTTQPQTRKVGQK
uniref:Uncharacterized protein n=1 Tax=Picea sitchensis TaxID=3332 RepID=D5ABL9_PICSI|nr:unknown [Picea sitchensis]